MTRVIKKKVCVIVSKYIINFDRCKWQEFAQTAIKNNVFIFCKCAHTYEHKSHTHTHIHIHIHTHIIYYKTVFTNSIIKLCEL